MRALISCTLVMLVAGTAMASGSGGGYSLRLEDEYGGILPTYEHRGTTYVQGVFGQRYNMRISNASGARVEAVVTVDGRDVLTGEAGDYVRQRGYIVPPYGSVLVEGFRQSYSDVAAFRFTDPGDSYSARRGTPQNVGVVGVAIFRENAPQPIVRRRPPPPPVYYEDMWGARDEPAEKRRSADADFEGGAGVGTTGPTASAPAAPKAGASGESRGGYGRDDVYRPAPEPQNNLGTAFGETRYSPVTEVPFVRARSSRPDFVLTAWYDDARGLAARGVLSRPEPYYSGPYPFPETPRRFAPPPP